MTYILTTVNTCYSLSIILIVERKYDWQPPKRDTIGTNTEETFPSDSQHTEEKIPSDSRETEAIKRKSTVCGHRCKKLKSSTDQFTAEVERVKFRMFQSLCRSMMEFSEEYLATVKEPYDVHDLDRTIEAASTVLSTAEKIKDLKGHDATD